MLFASLVEEIRKKSSLNEKNIFAPIIITANQRQARFIGQQLTKNTLIHLPEIITLEQWVKNTWLHLQDLGIDNTQRILLDSKQETFVWEDIVRSEKSLPTLIDTESIAKYVHDAYIILNNYAIDTSLLATSNESETQFLINVCKRFDQYLEKKHLCTQTQAIETIQSAYNNALLTPYTHAYLYGFIETYPALDRLLDVIAGGYRHIQNSPPSEQTLKRYALNDETREFEMAAHWAKAQITENPQAKIAIIVPNLTDTKSHIEHTFLKVFDPDFYKDNHQFETNRYVDISASDMLADTPVIHAVLSLLNTAQYALNKDQMKGITHSPFWGKGLDIARLHLLEWVNFYSAPVIEVNVFNREYAKIEMRLEQSNKRNDTAEHGDLFTNNKSPEAYTQDATEGATESTPENNRQDDVSSPAQNLLTFRHTLRKVKAQPSFAHWCEWLITQLTTLGWPGPRTLNSYEYQAVQSFFSVLNDMQYLDNVRNFGDVSLHSFTQQLNKQLAQTPFHVQTVQAPVQILGLMEAAGLPFDACWVTNMNEQQLPASPNPNPFIPLELQITYDTPRSSPVREYAYAQKLVEQLCQHTASIIFSYSHNGENTVHPSPFIADIPLFFSDREAIDEAHYPSENCAENIQSNAGNIITRSYIEAIQSPEDMFHIIPLGTAPIIAENETIKGGSYHLGLHAKNPLYAFLNDRVGAVTPNEENIGINAMDRGTVIHNLMAHIYTLYTNKNSIEQWLASDNYTHELTQQTEDILNSYLSRQQKRIPALLQNVEISLLVERVNAFLQLEMERPNFTMYAVEKPVKVIINKRHINLRIDRIDSIPESINNINNDGDKGQGTDSLIIFDYKSGSTSLSGLQTHPIYDCQLPLYLLSQTASTIQLTSNLELDLNPEIHDEPNKHVTGIGYIELSAKSINYNGICQDTNIQIPNFVEPQKLTRQQLPNTWEDACHWWEQQLYDLVTEVSLGQCYYHHRQPSKLLYYDHLHSAIRDEEISFSVS